MTDAKYHHKDINEIRNRLIMTELISGIVFWVRVVFLENVND